MLPATAERVPQNTASSVNQSIQQRTEENLRRYANAPSGAISERLNELDREWDIERMLEANAASISFTGVALGALVHRGFLLLPAVVGAFLFQHAVQGWCPPIPILRRMGFRTEREIDEERFALKAMRGDFRNLPVEDEDATVVREVLEAVRS